jgi:hypothetical protein
MTDDDIIGTITGVATFEKIAVSKASGGRVRVHADYGESETIYEAHQDNVFIGGLNLDLIHDEFWLRPEDGKFLYVEATEEELRITEDNPNDA